MTGRGHRIWPVRCQITLRQDWVFLPGHKGLVQAFAAKHHLRMLVGRAALGADQIVPTVVFNQMRRFNPDWFFRQIHAAIDQQFFRIFQHRFLHRIVLPHPDSAMAFVQRFTRRFGIVGDIDLTVVVKKDIRVDARHFRQPNRIRPGTGRIGCGHNKIATFGRLGRDCGVDQIKHPVVITDSWRVNALRDLLAAHIKLRIALQRMANQLPVHQIFTVQNRQARRHDKRRHRHVKIFRTVGIGSFGDGRVWEITGQYRVLVSAGGDRRSELRVAAFVTKPVKSCSSGCGLNNRRCRRGRGNHLGILTGTQAQAKQSGRRQFQC